MLQGNSRGITWYFVLPPQSAYRMRPCLRQQEAVSTRSSCVPTGLHALHLLLGSSSTPPRRLSRPKYTRLRSHPTESQTLPVTVHRKIHNPNCVRPRTRMLVPSRALFLPDVISSSRLSNTPRIALLHGYRYLASCHPDRPMRPMPAACAVAPATGSQVRPFIPHTPATRLQPAPTPLVHPPSTVSMPSRTSPRAMCSVLAGGYHTHAHRHQHTATHTSLPSCFFPRHTSEL